MCSNFGLLLNLCRCRLSLCEPLYFFLRPKAYLQYPQNVTKVSQIFRIRNCFFQTPAVQPPLPFYRKDAQPAKKWQVNNVLPPRRLIAPSLLTTEIVARSKHSSSKKLLLHEKLPKPPKGASKLTSFRAILAVRMHAAVRAEGLLAPLARRSLLRRQALSFVQRALDRCSATHCQWQHCSSTQLKALGRPADQLSAVAKLPCTLALDLRIHGGPPSSTSL